jgi:hypothetical protein
MPVAVTLDLVTLIVGTLTDLPVTVQSLPEDEKGGRHFFAAEKIEQAWRVPRVRAVVEGERNRATAFRDRTQDHTPKVALNRIDVQKSRTHD